MKQLSLPNVSGLFDEITSVAQLRYAFKAVRANKGIPGVDGVSIADFEVHLEEELSVLSQELRRWAYQPQPVKRVRIPKPGSEDFRLLGVPTVRDRVLHKSIQLSLERIYEPLFSRNSYGFRPGRSQRDALEQAKHFVEDGKEWVVDIDLERFFDTINHDRLIHRLKETVNDNRVLRLVGTILRSGVMDGEEFAPTSEGSVQGSPLSPLLSNVVLDELDKELEKRNLSFCRWADDCNIFVGSLKAGERVMKSVTKFIEKRLKLKVNPNKSKVAKSKYVKFLGMTIVNGMLLISQKAMSRAFDKVRELTPRRTHVPFEKQIEAINRWYIGWSGYFSQTETPSQLNTIEARIRRRLRAQLVCSRKRKRYLYRKLRNMGVPSYRANDVYTNRKTWALANCPAVLRAWTNEWFEEQGLVFFSGQALPHWQPLKLWVPIV